MFDILHFRGIILLSSKQLLIDCGMCQLPDPRFTRLVKSCSGLSREELCDFSGSRERGGGIAAAQR
jgi:hypothetical protein